jgi:hypothetical protein
MKITRKKARQSSQAGYPTLDEARRNRRVFLKFLGKGALAVSLGGLANCSGVGKESTKDAESEDWAMGGEAPQDIKRTPDEDWGYAGGIQAPDVTPDVGPPPDEWHTAGIAPADMWEQPDKDIQDEEFPQLMGDMEFIDIKSPDSCTKDIQGEDFPIPGTMAIDMIEENDAGQAPTPDAKGEVDAEEWPIDGDMPMPEE